MSQATFEALERALRAHAADETDGGVLAAWTLVAAAVRPEDAPGTTYVYANHDGAPHEWLGLQAMAYRRAMHWDAAEAD